MVHHRPVVPVETASELAPAAARLLFPTNPAPRLSLEAAKRTGSWQLEEGASKVVHATEWEEPQATREIRVAPLRVIDRVIDYVIK